METTLTTQSSSCRQPQLFLADFQSRARRRCLESPLREVTRRADILLSGASLSTKDDFRGPLVAQTSIRRLAQLCDGGLKGAQTYLQIRPFRRVRPQAS